MQEEAAVKCGCKGIRTCIQCERIKGIKPKLYDLQELRKNSYAYCSGCDLAWSGWERVNSCDDHHLTTACSSSSIRVAGIYVQSEFITENEEEHLLDRINAIPWVESQSGRRKQDFGPKVNFKKRKIRPDCFLGFPSFVRFLLDRFSSVPRLRGFRAVELCHLNYDPERGSTIDPHLDDAWLWGERLVTVNLGSPAVLTLTDGPLAVRVALDPRSLVVLSGDARHRWKHAVFREDVSGTRVAMTFRELSREFQDGGLQEGVGNELLQRAQKDI